MEQINNYEKTIKRTRNKEQNSTKFNIKLFLAIIAIAFLLSLFLEFFVFNFQNIINEKYITELTSPKIKGGKLIGENKYLGTEDNLEVIYTFPKKYVSNIKFNTGEVPPTTGTEYSVIVNDEDKLQKNISNPTALDGSFYGLNERTIPIKEKTNKIIILYRNINNQKIVLQKTKLTNKIQFNFIRFIMLFVMSSLILCIALYKKLNVSFSIAMLAIAIIFGGLFSMLTPPHHTWDERAHFIKSYSLSQGIFVLHDQEQINYPKEFDKLTSISGLEYYSYDEFKEVIHHYGSMKSKETEKVGKSTSALLNLFIPYMFSAIGIKIATIFNLPIIFLLWFGRMANVLFYVFMLYLAIKKTPVGKRLLAFFGLLPINLFIAASFSCDFLAMSCMLYAMAYILDLYYYNKIVRVKDFFVLGVLFTFVTIAKVSYAPVFILMWILGRNHFSSSKSYYLYLVSIAILMGGVAIGVYAYSQNFGISQWEIQGANEELQMKNIMYHPFSYVSMLSRYMSTRVIFYWNSMFGFFGHLGSVPEITTAFTSMILFYLSWFDPSDSSLKIDYMEVRGKLIIVCQFLGALFLSLTALYITFTPVNSAVVEGFQGRYIIPILFPIFFIFKGKYIKGEYSVIKMEYICFISTILIYISTFVLLISIHYYS